MSIADEALRPAGGAPANSSRLRRFARANPGAVAIVAGIVLLVAFGPHLAPYSPYQFNSAHSLEPPSAQFLFGTDEYGRDVFSRVLAGARPTILVAFFCTVIGVALGTITGLVTGYAGGVVDEVIMRVMDGLMSFPALILAMLVVVMLGANPVNVVVALGIVFWPRSTRLVRSIVVELAQREFVDAARSRGERWPHILLRELLPNIRSVIIVDFSLRFTYGILLSASLAYLGIGVSAPTPAWGLMVRDGQPFIEFAPWLIIFPCLAVTAAAIAMLVLGEKLRRAFDVHGALNRTGGR